MMLKIASVKPGPKQITLEKGQGVEGVGQETLYDGYVLLYSREDNHLQAGVGLTMSPAAYQTMMKQTPINKRILFAQLATTDTKLSVIVCYAPANEPDDDVKDCFSETLQAITKDIPKHNVLCVVGDLNAKVGANCNFCLKVLGLQGLGQISKNGASLIDFMLSDDLVVGGSLFEHKNVHKYTWTSPDGRRRNQIDHFLIIRSWCTSLLDMCGYRGADAQSYYMLMITQIQTKLCAQRKTQQDLKKLYNMDKLQDKKICRDFCILLWNKFDALAVEAKTLRKHQREMGENKSTYTMIAEEKLGFQKKLKERWMSDITWKLIDKQKRIKQEIFIATTRSSELATKHLYKEKDIKKSARNEKRQLLEN